MNEKTSNNGWKENLLKSSLPLEQLVAEQLERSGFRVAGEFPYVRPNEQGIKTEFSIDLHTFKTNGRLQETDGILEEVGRNSEVNLLIECKYTHPSVQWVFSPYLMAPYVPTPFICLHSECSSPLSDGVPHSLHDDLRICRRGIALSPNGFDPNVITHALGQLDYSLPNFVIANLEPSLKVLGSNDHTCICPILVTWESLKRKAVIKSEGTLAVLENARDEYFTRFLSYPFITVVVNLSALDNILQAIEPAVFPHNERKAQAGSSSLPIDAITQIP